MSKAGDSAREPATRLPMSDAAADRTSPSRRRSSGRCRGSCPAGSPVSCSSPSAFSAAGGALASCASSTSRRCPNGVERADGARRACDRPPGGDRVFDPGLGAGDRGPREAGDRASRGGAVGTERFAARGHPRARARPCPASRLPGEPRPDGDRDAALLPSGRLVGLPSGAVSREHCCDDLAVTVCRSRQEHVHALLDLEEPVASTALLALGATDGSLLRGRRLLAPAHGSLSSARLAASVIALTVVAAAVASASFHEAVVPVFDEPPVASEFRMEAQGVGIDAGGDDARHEWHARAGGLGERRARAPHSSEPIGLATPSRRSRRCPRSSTSMATTRSWAME